MIYITENGFAKAKQLKSNSSNSISHGGLRRRRSATITTTKRQKARRCIIRGCLLLAVVLLIGIQIILFSNIPLPVAFQDFLHPLGPIAVERRRRFEVKLQEMRTTTSLILESSSASGGGGDSSGTTTEEFTCVAWRSTNHCNPFGEKLYWLFGWYGDRSCDSFVPSNAGYCEIQSLETGYKKRLFRKTCNRPLLSGELKHAKYMKCSMAVAFWNYKYQAKRHEPQPPLLVSRPDVYYDNTNHVQQQQQQQQAPEGIPGNAVSAFQPYVPLLHAPTKREEHTAISRGIVIQIYDRVYAGVYAILKLLRDVHECHLPVELWCLKEELTEEDLRHNPILLKIFEMPDIHLRVIDDPEVESYMSKPYSVAYSNFEHVLFLDSDNFPLRNPEYLFDTTEFQNTGAIFWKDFWAPSRDEFYIVRNSVLWELLGFKSTSKVTVEMEMESGQILVDRRKSESALKVLLYFTKTFKEWFEPLGLVLGDKDLFRLAWHLSETPFHYIAQPPGTAGFEDTPESSGGRYSVCGLTMIQHDTEGEMIFFHRNAVKVTDDIGAVPIWEKGQIFVGNDEELYQIDQTLQWHHLGERMCYHPQEDSLPYFQEQDFRGTRIEWIEKTVIGFAKEAKTFLSSTPAE